MPKKSVTDRIAEVRGRCAAARPRITRRKIADRIGKSEMWVKLILQEHPNSIPEDTLAEIERAVSEIEAERAAAVEA